jgi:hypothetical protein
VPAAVVVSIVSVDLGGDSTYGSGELFLEGAFEPGGVFWQRRGVWPSHEWFEVRFGECNHR